MIVILLAGHLTGLEERCRGTWFDTQAGIWRHGECLHAHPFHPRLIKQCSAFYRLLPQPFRSLAIVCNVCGYPLGVLSTLQLSSSRYLR